MNWQYWKLSAYKNMEISQIRTKPAQLSPLPPHKRLHRFVFRQPQRPVRIGRFLVAVFRALPEFAVVAAGEGRVCNIKAILNCVKIAELCTRYLTL